MIDVQEMTVLALQAAMNQKQITGFSSMSIPIGSHENRIPIGAYWIAKRYDETTLLRITFAAESMLGVKCVPEMLE